MYNMYKLQFIYIFFVFSGCCPCWCQWRWRKRWEKVLFAEWFWLRNLIHCFPKPRPGLAPPLRHSRYRGSRPGPARRSSWCCTPAAPCPASPPPASGPRSSPPSRPRGQQTRISPERDRVQSNICRYVGMDVGVTGFAPMKTQHRIPNSTTKFLVLFICNSVIQSIFQSDNH